MTDKKNRIFPTTDIDPGLNDIRDYSDDDEAETTTETPRNQKKDRDYVDQYLYPQANEKIVDDLEEYIKWHRAHPRASTPRRARGNVEAAIATGVTRRCEHNPDLIYTQLPMTQTKVLHEFEPKQLGMNAEFAVVSSTAHNYEHSLRLDERDDFDDPWWNKSVKDQIYVHHLPDTDGVDDGSLWDDDASAIGVLDASSLDEILNKAAREREAKRQKKLDEVAISKQFGKPPRVTVSAWDNSHQRSVYTAEGQEALVGFTKANMEHNIQAALDEFEDPNRGGAFAKKGGGGMNKKARELHKTLAKYKNEIGGEEAIEKMSEGFIKMATKHRNQVKSSHHAGSIWGGFDMQVDFLDACVKVNIVKAIPMLVFGADANIVTEDDEPVFVMMLNKVIFSDSTAQPEAKVRIYPRDFVTWNLLRAAGPQHLHQESRERKNCMKILEALVKHGADINCIVGDEKLTPLHLTCGAGNRALTEWLLTKGADPNKRSPRSGLTPIMMAARYSNVTCIAEVVRGGGKVNARDDLGRTCLHHSALLGQTKGSQFILRLGCGRDIKDNEGKRAAALAEEEGYSVTAQVIMGFTPGVKPVSSPLKYLHDQLYKKEDSSVLDRLSNAIGGLFDRSRKEMDGSTRTTDNRGRLHRWWDSLVAWAESLFDGKSEADKTIIAKGWDAGAGALPTQHPDAVEEIDPGENISDVDSIQSLC